jgi:hypothetical protein
MGVFTMVVTSAVVPIPKHWMEIPRLRVAVSVDGLPEHHDPRRKPATYDRILRNIADRRVNVHWVITKAMLERPGYLEEYVSFWNARDEVDHLWMSLYTPQIGESSVEILSRDDRERLARELPALQPRYPKLLINDGIARAWVNPPENPKDCLFSKMSINYSADLKTRVEPCVFGGTPDCQQCGCGISSALDQDDPSGRPLEGRSFGSGFDRRGCCGGQALRFFRTSPLAGAAARVWRWQVGSGADQFVKVSCQFPQWGVEGRKYMPQFR